MTRTPPLGVLPEEDEYCPSCGVEWMGTSCGAPDCGWTWPEDDERRPDRTVECRDCHREFELEPGSVVGHGYVLCPDCARTAL